MKKTFTIGNDTCEKIKEYAALNEVPMSQVVEASVLLYLTHISDQRPDQVRDLIRKIKEGLSY
jgi:hypothetical protein